MSAGLVGGILSGVVASAIVVVLASTLFADHIANAALAANPTCASPERLKPIPRSDFDEPRGTAQGGGSPANYDARQAIDGYGGTIWVPRLAESKAKHPLPSFVPGEQSQLVLPLRSSHDVRLVCVVNGLANAYVNYENWGRVRTLKVWADARSSQTFVLQSLGQDNFPNAQLAGKNLGRTTAVILEVVDAYAGLTEESFDPDVCLKNFRDNPGTTPGRARESVQFAFEQGCLVPDTPMAGLAEVYLYEPQ
jgi:hypothetical protein